MDPETRKVFATRMLARMTTAIENREPHALAMLDALEPGHARIVGITGPPGAGKSTLVDALARELRNQGKTVAILAIDPSSRRTGGALLGDRIRMLQHYADPGIFIRSMATRGESGGIARATHDVARLMSASGKDYVLIETVGVGQDEVAIAALAQVTIVVLVPGMGDDIQAIKAGIMEIADIFVINKSDHPGADRVERELHAEGFTCPIVRTVASEGKGIAELVSAVAQASRPPAPQGRTGDLPHVDPALPLYDSTLDRLTLRVPDLDAAIASLTASGARLLNQPRPGANGHIYVFVHPASTGGVLLELIQEHTT
jgi:LAO/AO transport system kinase